MEYYDVRFNIMLAENNVKELRYLCNVDNISRNICLGKAFWVNKFKQQELFLPSYNLTTPEEWNMKKN